MLIKDAVSILMKFQKKEGIAEYYKSLNAKFKALYPWIVSNEKTTKPL